MRHLRTLLLLPITLLMAGCISFNGPTSVEQTGDLNSTVRYSFSVCSNRGSENVDGGPCDAPSITGESRTVVALLAPAGSTAPDAVTVPIGPEIRVRRGGSIVVRDDLRLFRSPQTDAEIDAAHPVPGHTWLTYITEKYNPLSTRTHEHRGEFDITIPVDAAGDVPPTMLRQVRVAHVNTDVDQMGTNPNLHWACFNPARVATSCITLPDEPQPVTAELRRMTVSAPSAVTMIAGSTHDSDFTLRLTGPELADDAVAVSVTSSANRVTATAPASVSTKSGRDIVIPVTIAAARGASSGAVTVTARTPDGTTRTATVQVAVKADTARPAMTLVARKDSSSKRMQLVGYATDAVPSSGLQSIDLQIYRSLGAGRCRAWTGTRYVNERCSRSTRRWTSVRTVQQRKRRIVWKRTMASPGIGIWQIRVRATDRVGRVSPVTTRRWVQR